MNRVVLIGRLTRNPTITVSQGENPVTIARFSLAINRPYAKEDQQSADFISCVAFGKTAETVQKYLSQGRRVALEGRINTGNYTNKDGQKVYTTNVVVEHLEFADSKPSDNAPTDVALPEGEFIDLPDDMGDEGLPFN